MTADLRLPASALFTACSPDSLNFDSTAQLEGLPDLIGQGRAREAIDFGVAVRARGYNLFVLGPPGLGKRTFARQMLEERAAAEAAPDDWCYVNNFDQPHRPNALRLPRGAAMRLKRDMQQLVDELRASIPAMFESEEYRTRTEQIDGEIGERQEGAFATLGEEASAEGIALLHTPAGFSLAPMRDGVVISPEDYEKLPAEERSRIESRIRELQEKLQKAIRLVQGLQKEKRDRIKALNREMTMYAVGHLAEELRSRYGDLPAVASYISAVEGDVLENIDEFRRPPDAETNILGLPSGERPSFRRYAVNVVVGDGSSRGAPVVDEDHPTYPNLVGRVEYVARLGTLVTDFTLIKAGALHRANGGYLLIDAYKLLSQPFAWAGMKRALASGVLRTESLGQDLGMISTVTLEPEAIPLDVKVVLFGERLIYYVLLAWDPEFGELFKVQVDFDDELVRDTRQEELYARLVATQARRANLLALDRGAVARVIEHAAREAGDARRLSAQLEALNDLLREADHHARSHKSELVRREHVQAAIDSKVRRADRIRGRMHEAILRRELKIDTDGEKVGQVNGLSVTGLGDFTFAFPTRITATTRLGDGEVIDIQREVDLSGPIHSKGVMILASYLVARYSCDRPHSLSASLVFEQTYATVEGDSASLAELCALLSSIGQFPLQQSLAVTGAVDQHGGVQPIGAVNEKIEGFFDICRARGLTGQQGVIVPGANVEHLMLREDVVEAVADGDFAVFRVDTVDQALGLLAGAPAGEADGDGNFPEGSPNFKVSTRLLELSMIRQAYSAVEIKVKKVRAGIPKEPEHPPRKPRDEKPIQRGRRR